MNDRPCEAPASPTAESSMPVTVTVALTVFLPFAAGFFLSYVYRAVTAVIAPNLVQDVGLRASQIGFLTSVYFLAFAFFQLPVGLLLDRFGPRRVESALLLFAAVGAVVFAVAQGLPGLTLGRGLIGIGVACCMMAAFKAFVLWFRPRTLPMINGFLMTFGALGAISATTPVEWLLRFWTWRELFVAMAVATAAVSAAVFFIVPDHHESPLHTRFRDQLGGLGAVFRDRFFWRVAPVAGVVQGGSLAFQGLWAGPWLRDVAGLGRAGVADHLLIMAVGLSIGFVSVGIVSERLSRIGIRPLWVMGGGVSLFIVLMFLIAAGLGSHAGLILGLLGLTAASGTLSYALVSQHFDRHLAGRANTAVNLMVFVGAFALQWGIGVVIGHWENPITHRYAPTGYLVSLGGVAALDLLALGWLIIAGRHPGAR